MDGTGPMTCGTCVIAKENDSAEASDWSTRRDQEAPDISPILHQKPLDGMYGRHRTLHRVDSYRTFSAVHAGALGAISFWSTRKRSTDETYHRHSSHLQLI